MGDMADWQIEQGMDSLAAHRGGHCDDDCRYCWDEDAGPSLNLIALWYDEGRACGECTAEFTAANGTPSCCQTCKNMGSDLPLSRHAEKNTEAHKQRARKRRKAKENR